MKIRPPRKTVQRVLSTNVASNRVQVSRGRRPRRYGCHAAWPVTPRERAGFAKVLRGGEQPVFRERIPSL